MRLTYGELASILTNAVHLIKQYDTQSDRTLWTYQLTLTGNEDSVVPSNDFSRSALLDAPPASYSLTYNFSGPSVDPVSEVNVELGDFQRTLSVTGTSQADVDALFALLETQLAQYRVLFPGSDGSRFLVGMVVVVFALGLLLVGLSVASERVRIAASLAGLALVLIVALPPWRHILTVFVVYPDNSSFLTRYEPEMTLAGLLVGAAVAFVGVLRWVSAPGKPPEKSSAGSPSLSTARSRR